MTKKDDALKLALDYVLTHSIDPGVVFAAIKDALEQSDKTSCYCPNCEALSRELSDLKDQQEPDVVMHTLFNTWTINKTPPKGIDDVGLWFDVPNSFTPIGVVYKTKDVCAGVIKESSMVSDGQLIYAASQRHQINQNQG